VAWVRGKPPDRALTAIPARALPETQTTNRASRVAPARAGDPRPRRPRCPWRRVADGRLRSLPSFLGRRQRPVDLGPIAAFREGEFVVATFLADPKAGEVSRRAAYVRNNGLVGNLPSFTIMSSEGARRRPGGAVAFVVELTAVTRAAKPEGMRDDPHFAAVRALCLSLLQESGPFGWVGSRRACSGST